MVAHLKLARTTLTALLLVGLAACGGNQEESRLPEPVPVPTPLPEIETASSPYSETVTIADDVLIVGPTDPKLVKLVADELTTGYRVHIRSESATPQVVISAAGTKQLLEPTVQYRIQVKGTDGIAVKPITTASVGVYTFGEPSLARITILLRDSTDVQEPPNDTTDGTSKMQGTTIAPDSKLTPQKVIPPPVGAASTPPSERR